MYLRDVAVFADEAIVERFPDGFVGWFHRETCCVTEFYASLLRKTVFTPDTVKANLVFVERDGSLPKVTQLLSVADARWPFAFHEYSERDAVEKKRMILDAVHRALLWIANQRDWDTNGIEDCYASVVAHNLTFERWSKKSWPTPNRPYRLRIGFMFELRSIEFFVGLFSRKGIEVGRKHLGSVVSGEGIVNEVLSGSGRWVRGHFFRLQVNSSCFYVPRSWTADLSDLLS